MMKVSVIIPTYNRSHYICQTIDSFLTQDYPKSDYEIIVCDNNSNDNTKEIIEKYLNNSYGVKFTYLFEGRQGVHYARNSAAKVANNELLYFTDDDMIADQNMLKEIVLPFILHNKVGVVTGKVLPEWENNPPTWILKHCNNYLLSLLSPEYDFLIADSINFLYSCHQAVRKDVFFLAEGFNPEYTKDRYLGDGETGLNRKIRRLNFKFAFNGKSITYHIIPKSRCTQSYLNKRLNNNGRAHAYTFYNSNPSILQFILAVLKTLTFNIPSNLSKIFGKFILRKDYTIYHIALAQWHYFVGFISYSTNLLKNKNLRKFVAKKDWLTNDDEFDNLKF